MKSNKSSLTLGLSLIAVGGLALAGQMGYLNQFSISTWAVVLAVVSLFFFVIYFINGIHAWGWLFPAFIFAGLAGALALDNTAAEEWMPTIVLGSVAVPFIFAFVLDRSRRWALNVVFLLVALTLIPLITNYFSAEWIGGVIITIIGLQFILTYLLEPKAWWAIIPGGIMLSIAAMVILQGVLPNLMPVAVIFLGMMLTFGFVWLRQSRPWARIPAIVMGILACVIVLVGMGLVTYWAAALIVAGLVLVILSFKPNRQPAS